jgi:hypothetical protein
MMAVALSGGCMSACGSTDANTPGSASTVATSSVAPASGGHASKALLNDSDNDASNDNDLDNLNGKTVDDDHDIAEDRMNPENDRYHDSDDAAVMSEGHAATASQARAIAVVVRNYYKAAARADGAAACSMMYSVFAESVVEDYGEAPGPAYLRGAKTCRAVATLLFEHERAQLAGTVKVTGVRVDSRTANALIGSSTMPASRIGLKRELGVWKIEGLIGTPLP